LVTATVLPTDHQRRLQRSLEENRQRMLMAFSVAQEMISRGERAIREDLTYEARYGEVILNMATCLAQMAQMAQEEVEREPLDALPIRLSGPLSPPLASGRAPGGGMAEHEYRERHQPNDV
jgi:hypothetical protein